MSIESETRSIPTEVRCPQCNLPNKQVDVKRDIYECPNCGLQYEATIEISWDSKHYSRR